MKISSSLSRPLRWAVLAGAVGLVSLAWHDAPAADAPAAPPAGSYVGVISVKSMPVQVRLELHGEGDGSVDYGPTLDCGLALTFITATEDGFAYAFKPRSGGSAGMAPYCNRLLGGRAWLMPRGTGLNYVPLDDRGAPLHTTVVEPVPARR
ncbi:MAG: hypothetical protein K9J82_05110 [Methylotenera sp.]|jgi:hypothetical protein|nr:hypothetical protein [Methylotenera sp.]